MKRVAFLLIAILLFAALRSAGGSATTSPAADAPPLRYRLECRTDPPQRMHILTVDLTDPRVGLRVALGGDIRPGFWTTMLDRPSVIAKREGFVAAININSFAVRDVRYVLGRQIPYFIGNPASIVHWCMCDSRLLNSERPEAALIVDDDRTVRIGRFDRIDARARQVAGGFGPIVQDGRNVAKKESRAPRTAAGIDASAHTLTLLVVDGRRPGFATGMTPIEVGDEMIRLGCACALDFDGGGSSAMVLSDVVEGCPKPTTMPATDPSGPWVVNRPSDGHDFIVPISVERPVACVLGISLRP